MQKIRFLYDNWFDSAYLTLTASTEDDNFPVSNIQHPWWTRHWRSTSKTGQWVKWHFNWARAPKAFIMKGHNLSGGHIHLQGNATDVWTAPTVDWAIDIEGDPVTYQDDTFPALEYWRVDLSSATSDDSYFKIGRIYSGQWWSPTYNFDYIYRKKLIDPSEKTYSTGLQMSANVRQKLREVGYHFSFVTQADMETLDEIFWDYVGLTVPYWICQDYDEAATTTMYVENIESWEFEHSTASLAPWKLAVAVRELA